MLEFTGCDEPTVCYVDDYFGRYIGELQEVCQKATRGTCLKNFKRNYASNYSACLICCIFMRSQICQKNRALTTNQVRFEDFIHAILFSIGSNK